MDKRVKPLLQLLTLLVVGGNGWCYGVSEGWAQTEAPQPTPTEIMAQTTNDSGVIAKPLLRQLETAVYGLEDDGAKAYGLVAIAASYLVFSEESTATEHLTQALNLLDTIPDQSVKSAVISSVVATTTRLSDEALVGDLVARALAKVDHIQGEDSTKAAVFSEVAWRLSYLSNQDIANKLLNQASTIANGIVAHESKSAALLSLVDAYVKFTDPATVTERLTQALNAINAIDDEPTKTSYLTWWMRVSQQSAEGRIDPVLLEQGLTVTNTLQGAENRARVWAYMPIVADHFSDNKTAEDMLNQAITIAADIQADIPKAIVLSEIVSNYSYVDQPRKPGIFLKHALTAAAQIKDTSAYAMVLTRVVTSMTEMPQILAKDILHLGLTQVNRFPDDWSQVESLVSIADGYLQLSDEASAETLLTQAVAIMERSAYEPDKAYVLGQFVDVASNLSDPTTNQQLLTQTLGYVNRITAPESRLSSLVTLAYGHYFRQENAKGMAILDQIITTAESTQEQTVKTQALVSASSVLYAIHTSSEATEAAAIQSLVNRILLATDGLEDSETHGTIFIGIADFIAFSQNPTVQAALLEELLEIVNTLESPQTQANGLGAIAKIYVFLNESATATDYLNQALEAINQIENEADRLPPLRRIIFSARSPHGGPVSPALLSQALRIVNDSHSDAVLYDGLVAIASMSGSTLDTPTGQTLFNEILASTDRINDPWNRVDALSMLARAMAEIAQE